MTDEGPPLNVAPLNVAVVVTELDDGGAERALVEIVTCWPADWSVRVVSLGGETPLAGRLRESGVEVTSLSAPKRRPLKAVRRVRGLLKRQRPDVVLTWLFHGNLVGRLAAVGLGVPVVATHRVAERSATWHLRLERLTGRLVNRHIAVSESVAAFLRETGTVPASKPMMVVPNGVNPDRVRPRRPVGNAFHAVAAGRLHEQKGFDVLLDAWKLAGRGGTLTIYGEGPDRAILEAAAGEGVSLPGRVDDLFEPLSTANVFVLSSRWEGMPNVLLEAAAAGCPVVATDVEGVQEVLGPDADLATPGDVASLSAEIAAIRDDPASAEAAARRTQATVLERSRWPNAAASVATVLRAATESAGRKNSDPR